jgi:hypothetical protein
LSESSFTYSSLRASGLARRLLNNLHVIVISHGLQIYMSLLLSHDWVISTQLLCHMVFGWNNWIFILSFSFVFCRIERSLTYLLKKMKDLFSFLYLFPRAVTPQLERMVGQIRERTRQKLKDFKDYLSVKAQRNITMTSYPYMWYKNH